MDKISQGDSKNIGITRRTQILSFVSIYLIRPHQGQGLPVAARLPVLAQASWPAAGLPESGTDLQVSTAWQCLPRPQYHRATGSRHLGPGFASTG
jgi:hypothetical protein